MSDLRYPKEHLRDALSHSGIFGENSITDDYVEGLGGLLDLLFFVSLATEEGTPTTVRVVAPFGGIEALESLPPSFLERVHPVYQSPAWVVHRFVTPRRATLSELAKAAVAADVDRRTAVVLGADANGDEQIEGLARLTTDSDGGRAFVASALGPGRLLLTFAGKEVMRYEQGKLVPPAPDAFAEGGPVREAVRASVPEILRDAPERWRGSVESFCVGTLKRLIRHMEATGHGGIIAVAPRSPLQTTRERAKFQLQRAEVLKEAVLALLKAKAITGPRTVGAEDAQPLAPAEVSARELEQLNAQYTELVADVGRWTAVDNALLLGPDFEVVGAGYPIAVAPDKRTVVEALDEKGDQVRPYDITAHGARHRAAAAFAWDWRGDAEKEAGLPEQGGLVFIASEDGPVKCMLRIGEKLVLWRLGTDAYPRR